MKGSKYPTEIDGNENLYLVHDALKVPLGLDYYPGHTSVLADGDISKFPANGIITLVDQCSLPSERAISLYYGKRTNREFNDLELMPDSLNCYKPKKITMITLQVMSEHREALKDAIFSIEKFLGTKHEIAAEPKKGSIFGRLNFMRKILFAPKAWFEIDKTTGATPFVVNFNFAGSGNVGPVGEVTYDWKFNDEEIQTKEPYIEKTFLNPGSVTVSLTVTNHYGKDTVTFIDMINVRGQAPEMAKINFVPAYNQVYIKDIVPKIRTPINQPVYIEVPQKNDEKKTFAGELIDPTTNKIVDSVTTYTWNLGDDLPHANSSKTKGVYSVGGVYDLVLRTDTELGAYRITNYENCIDVVEPTNLWFWSCDDQNIRSYEFGLISEVLKTSNNTYSININDKFLNNKRQKFEFWRNNGIAKVNNLKSGDGGDCLLFWASGRDINDASNLEHIEFTQYNGFADTYKKSSALQRPWNWASLITEKDIYFVFGLPAEEQPPTVSATHKDKLKYNIATGASAHESLEYRNYKNGGHDLMYHSDVFDENYNAPHGHFSAYRTTWKGNTGYILRNSNLGEYFSIQNFYKTEGTLGSPIKSIVKLPDMPGDNKEGTLVALHGGVYFFNNHGGTYCFNDSIGAWESVHSHNKVAKNELDCLLAASDLESRAYISIENGAFFKFNEIDMSYSTFSQEPINKQWLMTVY